MQVLFLRDNNLLADHLLEYEINLFFHD